MLNCHQNTRLISEGRERRLTFVEGVSVGAHNMMCSACRNFSRQMDTLEKMMKAYKIRSERIDE